jgi:uncharacterized protein YdbL (DUF1318 family)
MENQQNITVADLDLLRNLINVACTRGAFHANEAKTVGEVYEKLTGFLELVAAQSQASNETSQGEQQ